MGEQSNFQYRGFAAIAPLSDIVPAQSRLGDQMVAEHNNASRRSFVGSTVQESPRRLSPGQGGDNLGDDGMSSFIEIPGNYEPLLLMRLCPVIIVILSDGV